MIVFKVNNEQKLIFKQHKTDECVHTYTRDTNGNKENELTISNGDFVMLLNYYKYVKDNNIQCDFINPNGKECL